MKILILTALGVGGATVLGSVLGFVFKDAAKKYAAVAVGLAAGVMLAASVLGLILPSLESGGTWALTMTVAGVLFGAFSLKWITGLVPKLYGVLGLQKDGEDGARRVLVFVLAIAAHNLPEGMAAGVGFGGGDTAAAISVAGGIALQNIPEGMVIIAPMLAAGISPTRTFAAALFTGLVEVIGAFLGFAAVKLFAPLMPFALSAAGGTMLYVIADDMISEMHARTASRGATYALLVGFCLMLAFDFYC